MQQNSENAVRFEVLQVLMHHSFPQKTPLTQADKSCLLSLGLLENTLESSEYYLVASVIYTGADFTRIRYLYRRRLFKAWEQRLCHLLWRNTMSNNSKSLLRRQNYLKSAPRQNVFKAYVKARSESWFVSQTVTFLIWTHILELLQTPLALLYHTIPVGDKSQLSGRLGSCS